MGRIRLAIAIILLLAFNANAEDLYVCVSGEGAGATDGSNWANCFDDFADVVWGASAGQVGAGDTLYIDGGSAGKTYTSKWAMGASGSSGNLITIRPGSASPSPSGHDGKVTFDFTSSSNTTAGIQLNSYTDFNGENSGSNNIEINNCIYTSSWNAGVSVAFGPYATGRTGIHIRYVDVDNANGGVAFNAPTAIEIDHCSFTNIRGDGAVALVASSVQSFDNCLVHNNTISLLGKETAGVWYGPDGVQTGHGVSIYNNSFRVDNTALAISSQHTDFVQSVGSYKKIYNNIFTNICDSAIDQDFGDPYAAEWQAVTNIWIYNNVFRILTDLDIYPQYIRMYTNSGGISLTNVKIFNNTFIDNNAQSNAIMYFFCSACSAADDTDVEVKNNIFYQCGNGSTQVIFWLRSGFNTGSEFVLGYNRYYSTSSPQFLIGASSYYTLAQWLTSYDTDNSTSGDVSFTSYSYRNANNNLTLQVGDTGAKDQGVDLSAYFTTDKDGNTRSGAWDIGAYEYTAPSISTIAVATNGTTVTITASEALTQGVGYNDTDLDIDCPSNANIGLTYVSGDGTATLVYTAAQTILASDGSSCNFDFNGDANSLEDGDGNDLAAIVSQSVDNNSSQGATANTGRVMQYNAAGKAAVYNANGYQLVAP